MEILIGIILIFAFAGVIYVMYSLWCGYKTANSLLHQKPAREYYDDVKAKENYCPLNNISENLKTVIICMEDFYFYKHPGFQLYRILGALYKNITHRKFLMGGSTITQQLAKNMYFPFKKTVKRKIAELFVALHLEKEMSKDEILDSYLNIIYYGMDKYGIKDACSFYFGKSPETISVNEAVTLGSLLPAPTNYNPLNPNGLFVKARRIGLEKLKRRKALRAEDIEAINASKYNDIIHIELLRYIQKKGD